MNFSELIIVGKIIQSKSLWTKEQDKPSTQWSNIQWNEASFHLFDKPGSFKNDPSMWQESHK